MKKPSGNFDVDDYLVRILPQPWLHHIPRFISHWFGYRPEPPKKRPDVIILLWTWIGAFCGVSVIEAVFQRNSYFVDRGVPMIVGSFGATAVLLYGAIEAPFAQPRAVFFGHTLSAITGVCITKLFETNEARFLELRWLAGAIACATASVIMTVTKTIHPPSGATAMIAATQADITALGWYYIPVVMLSASLALSVGLITNNIQRRYPVFWLLSAKIPARQPTVEEKPVETPPSDGALESGALRKSEATQAHLQRRPSEISHKEHIQDPYKVIVNRDEIVVPEFIELESEHLQVLQEIQTLLNEHHSASQLATPPNGPSMV